MTAKTVSRRRFLALGASLACVLAFDGYMASDAAVAKKTTFPGIRFYPGLGVRGNDTTWSGGASYVQGLYDTYGAPRESRYFLTTPHYWFIAEKKLEWKNLLVDETLAPISHDQARNPGWSNYRWNEVDVISQMLQAPAIAGGAAKLSLLIAATATSCPDPVPSWMKAKGLTWTDGEGRVHVRQDLEEGWRYIADLYVAIVKRYGESSRIANLIMGEYYPLSDRPASLDFKALLSNAKKIWSDVIANAPKDEGGNRVNIAQVNPILTKGIVTSTDIANLKLGISGSDPHLFANGCGKPHRSLGHPGTLDRARQDLYGTVPLMHQGDAAFLKSGKTATWTGIANPFGYTAGETVPIDLEQLAWYFGSKGVVPLNSMTIKDNSLLTEDWFSTFDRLGPDGTQAAAWGHLPNYPGD